MADLQVFDEVTGFEGCEKKLQVRFVGANLRLIPRPKIVEVLDAAKCTILQSQHNEFFDAYVLSESSLFIYPYQLIIKTCGTTSLLHGLPVLLAAAAEIGALPILLQFSRSNFMFPHLQPFPHRNFSDETHYLNTMFTGSAYILGAINGPRWHVYFADVVPRGQLPELAFEPAALHHKLALTYQASGDKKLVAPVPAEAAVISDNEESPADDDVQPPKLPAPVHFWPAMMDNVAGHAAAEKPLIGATLEMVMFNLDPEAMKLYYKSPEIQTGDQCTRLAGIDQLIPGSQVDAFLFEPCGYSCNAMREDVYFTIHITPEPQCSFVSFETNLAVADYSELVARVLRVFRPGSFSVSLMADDDSPLLAHSSQGLRWRIPGFRTQQLTSHSFAGGYNITAGQYVNEAQQRAQEERLAAAAASLLQQELTPRSAKAACAAVASVLRKGGKKSLAALAVSAAAANSSASSSSGSDSESRLQRDKERNMQPAVALRDDDDAVNGDDDHVRATGAAGSSDDEGGNYSNASPDDADQPPAAAVADHHHKHALVVSVANIGADSAVGEQLSDHGSDGGDSHQLTLGSSEPVFGVAAASEFLRRMKESIPEVAEAVTELLADGAGQVAPMSPLSAAAALAVIANKQHFNRFSYEPLVGGVVSGGSSTEEEEVVQEHKLKKKQTVAATSSEDEELVAVAAELERQRTLRREEHRRQQAQLAASGNALAHLDHHQDAVATAAADADSDAEVERAERPAELASDDGELLRRILDEDDGGYQRDLEDDAGSRGGEEADAEDGGVGDKSSEAPTAESSDLHMDRKVPGKKPKKVKRHEDDDDDDLVLLAPITDDQEGSGVNVGVEDFPALAGSGEEIFSSMSQTEDDDERYFTGAGGNSAATAASGDEDAPPKLVKKKTSSGGLDGMSLAQARALSLAQLATRACGAVRRRYAESCMDADASNCPTTVVASVATDDDEQQLAVDGPRLAQDEESSRDEDRGPDGQDDTPSQPPVCSSETRRQLLRRIIDDDEACDGEAFFLVDIRELGRRYGEFLRALPRVQPFYNVRCNSDPGVIAALAELGCGFQCGSAASMKMLATEHGVDPEDRMAFVNPWKPAKQIGIARELGVQLLAFDHDSELLKIKRHHPEAQLLLQIDPFSGDLPALIASAKRTRQQAAAAAAAAAAMAAATSSGGELSDNDSASEATGGLFGGGAPGKKGKKKKLNRKRAAGQQLLGADGLPALNVRRSFSSSSSGGGHLPGGNMRKPSATHGASLDFVEPLLAAARDLGLQVVGVSVKMSAKKRCCEARHMCRGIKAARAVFELARARFGMQLSVLDLGDTFPSPTAYCMRRAAKLQAAAAAGGSRNSNAAATGHVGSFEEMARAVSATLDAQFPAAKGWGPGALRVLADPARYVVTTSHTLAVSVIGKREIQLGQTGSPLLKPGMSSNACGVVSDELLEQLMAAGGDSDSIARMMALAAAGGLAAEVADAGDASDSAASSSAESDDEILGHPGSSSILSSIGSGSSSRERADSDDSSSDHQQQARAESPFGGGGGGVLANSGLSSLTAAATSTLLNNKACQYYINDGLYGSFNCLLYDKNHSRVAPQSVRALPVDAPRLRSTLFGPTCDGLDCVLEECELPDLSVGDWLFFEDMGAHTLASGTNFNGFVMPASRYLVARS